MKIFVFPRIDKLTKNYHEAGGLAVVAKDRDQVIQLLKASVSSDPWGDDVIREDFEITPEEWKAVFEYELMDTEKPIFFIFPDAGCC